MQERVRVVRVYPVFQVSTIAALYVATGGAHKIARSAYGHREERTG